MTATIPKQEAVTAAVVASLEPWQALYALDNILNYMREPNAHPYPNGAADVIRTFVRQHASTIPRVADHLEDGGKAEAALRELVEARDALSKANAALNARFRTEQFVRVTMPSPEAERMDAAWSVARRIVVEADPQRTAIGMRREGETGNLKENN